MKTLVLSVLSMACFATWAERVELWPAGRMPSACTNQTVTPYVEFFAPAKASTDAVLIVAPGGAYVGWAGSVEGDPVRDYFLAKGMNVAMLRYRTPRPAGLPKHLTAWQDAQRAVRLVRAQAAQRGYNPDRIGFMGFSAGGHLTLMAALSSRTPAYEPIDALDRISCSLNWAVPVYPAYVLADGVDGGNRNRGQNLTADALNPEFAFDAGTPPLCLMHGDADVYAAMGSVRVYHRLRTMGIPAEMHVMAHMPHVFFRNCHAGEPAAEWLDRVWSWLYAMGLNTRHPCTYVKGWRMLVPEYGALEKVADFKKGVWSRDAQNVLSANQDSAFWLKGEYERFELDFEYRLDPAANSGVIIYCSDVKNWIPNSIEVQLLDDAAAKWCKDPPRLKNGALYGHIGPATSSVKPAGEWNRMTIRADGKRIRVIVNGEVSVDEDISRYTSAKTNPDGTPIQPWLSKPLASLPTKGAIGFQGMHGGAKPYFRQIRIRSLD